MIMTPIKDMLLIFDPFFQSQGLSLSATQVRLSQSKLSFREPIEDGNVSVDHRPDTSQYDDKEATGESEVSFNVKMSFIDEL